MKLIHFLESLGTRLTADQVDSVRELIVHGEEGIGLEDICVNLCEGEQLLEGDSAEKLKSLCGRYGVTDDYWKMAVKTS